jgi:hypothetical protein
VRDIGADFLNQRLHDNIEKTGGGPAFGWLHNLSSRG